MRYPPEHKQATRERIVRAAARRFGACGRKSAAIGDLMRGLRLTHGGFYRHFNNKDDLFAEALEQALQDRVNRLNAAVREAKPGQKIEAIIDAYLDVNHCDDMAAGCPVAALAAEVARRPQAARERLLQALRAHITRLQGYMPGKTDDERRRKTIALMSGMSGTLSIACAFPNEEDRRAMLEGAGQFYRGAVRT